MKHWKNTLREYWRAYLCVPLLALLIWMGIFTAMDRVHDNERLTLAVYAKNCDAQALRADLIKRLPELTEQKISELYVDALTLRPESANAKTLLTMQLLQSDLAILPESLLQALETPEFFPELPEKLTANLETYRVDGKSYGILICNPAYFGSQERCYVLLSESSKNLGAIFGKGSAEDDAALAVLRELTRQEEA